MASAHRFRSIYRSPLPKVYKREEPPSYEHPPDYYGGEEGIPQEVQEYQQYQINSQNHLLEPVQQQSSAHYQERTKPIKPQDNYKEPQPTFTATASRRSKKESKKKAIQKDLDRIFNF